MPGFTIDRAYDDAVALQNAGRLADAESLYRQILDADPRHVDATQMLGVLMARAGRADAGLDLVKRASLMNPDAASCHANIGMILAGQGKLEPAIQSFRRALELQSNSPVVHNNLANVFNALGRFDEAIESSRNALGLDPNFATAHNNLGAALCAVGRTDEGIASLRKAIALKPDYVEAHLNLAKAQHQRQDWQAAFFAVQRALNLHPSYPDALTFRGVLLQHQGGYRDAIDAYKQSLAIRPDDRETLNCLGTACLEMHLYDQAIESYRRAVSLGFTNAEALGNLGRALGEVGDLDQALAAYRKSLNLMPEPHTASGMLLYLHLHPEMTPSDILREHRNWNETYAKPGVRPTVMHQNDPDPNRRLRIGFVSPNFTKHPVGRFMLPYFARHDRSQVEVVCYSDTKGTDANTRQIRELADLWRDTSGLTDQQLAAQVTADKIDILVDLLMHAKGCRLLAFAQKPAPVQITYLSYCGTTGVDAMDYRISDPYIDPPGSDESAYVEKTLRLPNCFWCFEPTPEAPEIGPLPAIANGFITFGCLNNYCKLGPVTLTKWFDLLGRVPESRLILNAYEGEHRERLRDRMRAAKLDPARVEFYSFQPLGDYLQLHTKIDIALDPFPYCGGTTSCEALWMGVPVVTLAGKTAVSRSGMSILRNVGLGELVAQSWEQYLNIALGLATDWERLAELRSTMRSRMQQSPLMSAAEFTRALEAIFRIAWRNWCSSQAGKT